MYEVGFWFNHDEAVTSIEIDGSAEVRLGEDENTIYVNDILINLKGSIAYIHRPDGSKMFSIY